MTKLTIRVLESQDLPQVASLHLAAFPDSALSKLGLEGVLRYYSWQMSGPHDAIKIGIFENDQLLGFCFAGVFNGALTGFLRKNILFLIWRIMLHPNLLRSSLFFDRVKLAVRTLLRKPTKPAPQIPSNQKSFGILSIAILPSVQGNGLGNRLMEYTESCARDRGFGRMHLTVGAENKQAIGFYERLGWKKSSLPDEIWRGLMTKLLES